MSILTYVSDCFFFFSLSLGKATMHSLASWSTDIRHTVENKVGHHTAIPNNVDVGPRNATLGVETAVSHPQSVEEKEEKSSKPLGRTMSTRPLGLRADIPHNVDTARSSIANIPPSAASTVNLFEDF